MIPATPGTGPVDPVTDDGALPRPLPALNYDNQAFWQGGKEGELCIYQCQACRYLIHPPVRFCPQCEGRDVQPGAVSGLGILTSFTVNHKQWLPHLPVPYVVALVSLVEQDDVRLVSNITHCAPDQVFIGMKLRVYFEQVEDIWIPLFRPAEVIA